MNKNLENKIMDQVYVVEAKRTGLSLGAKLIGFIFVGGAVLFLVQIIREYVEEGGIINMFAIISEDRDVFATHIGGVVRVLFDEVPSPLMIAAVMGIVMCALIVLTIVLNFEKIRNRIRAVVLHWKQR